MGKGKRYKRMMKNHEEQKLFFQEEIKLDYSKLGETIAEAIKIEKERENENKRKHSKKRELLYKTLNIIFYMVLIIIVLSLLYSICMVFISGKIDDIVGFLLTFATLSIIIIIMILCFDEAFQDDVEEAANHLGVNVAVLALILSLISLIK
ncbi:MAG: hypothetical protein ACLTBS_08370 [Eisenbergiella sp.]